MPTHVADVCLACTVCDSHTLSSVVTSCDSWLKVGSSGPVGPDQPGETLEIHRDRGNRTWWHPPCHPLSQPASRTVYCLSLQPPVSLQPSLAAIHANPKFSQFIFTSFSQKNYCIGPRLYYYGKVEYCLVTVQLLSFFRVICSFVSFCNLAINTQEETARTNINFVVSWLVNAPGHEKNRPQFAPRLLPKVNVTFI